MIKLGHSKVNTFFQYVFKTLKFNIQQKSENKEKQSLVGFNDLISIKRSFLHNPKRCC